MMLNETFDFSKTATSFRNPDVVILGSGVSGDFLAGCLARQGVDVLVLDHSSHPKFTIGESMVPYLSVNWRGMADYWDVPELGPDAIRDALSHSVGQKQNFTTVYHRAGMHCDGAEITQHVSPTGDEMHLYRQDVDQYMINQAIKLGVKYRFNTKVIDVRTDKHAAHVDIEGGESIQTRFVFDASGYQSVLCKKFDLRKNNNVLRTRSSSCFTHMIDVEPFDAVLRERPSHIEHPMHNGTLHHIFEHGWMWVIPFNNTKMSVNPMVSVGLQINTNVGAAPKPEDVIKFIKAHPDIESQFRNAKVVRPWVAANNLQYASTTAAGLRWCLLPHAYGFVDPLYSRGLCLTFDGIKMALPFVLEALRTDVFHDSTHGHLNNIYSEQLRFHDDLVYGSYLSFMDIDLWKSWYLMWNLSTRVGEGPTMQSYSVAKQTRDFTRFLNSDVKGNMRSYDGQIEDSIRLLEDANNHRIGLDEAVVRLRDTVTWCRSHAMRKPVEAMIFGTRRVSNNA